MKKFSSILLATALLFPDGAARAAGQFSANFVMSRDTLNAGVGAMSSANFAVSSSLGDAVAGGTTTSVGFQLQSGFRAQISAPPAILNLLAVFSRGMHGSLPFDLSIDRMQPITGAITVEPRTSGAGGSGHMIVFRFDGTVTAEGAATALDQALNSAATVTLSRNANDVIAILTNVADNKRLTISLTGVNGSMGTTVSMGFLIGDVTSSRSVNAADLSAIKANLNLPVNGATRAKFDLNADGSITAADLSLAKARSGRVIP